MTGPWADYRPEDLATPRGVRRNPDLVWSWYRMRRSAAAAARPTAGHLALAALERLVPGCTLITQNVDGPHARSGSRDVVELHGNIGRVKCFDCSRVPETFEDTEAVPRCPACGGMLRPDVVWFGEGLPPRALERAQQAAAGVEVFLSIGTSNVVAAPWPDPPSV